MSKRPETAQVLRRLIEQRDAGVELDPWLPFPSSGCCFSFGPQKQPVPIGALFLLWSAGAPYVQPCHACSAPAYMISFGGLFNVGGGTLVCASCSHSWLHHISGLTRVRELLAKSPLETSDFRPTGVVFGGVIGSDGRELCELLGVSEPTDDVGETSLQIEGGPSLSIHLRPEKVGATEEGSVDGADEEGRSASDARSPRYAGCLRHEVNESKDSRPEKQRIDWLVGQDRQNLNSFVENLKSGVEFDEMDDELKSWWLSRY